MRVAILTSEAVPFAKTGGLADVSGALPKALTELDVDARLILPLYDQIDRRLLTDELIENLQEAFVRINVRPYHERVHE